ncbi:MAG: methylmalonyl-CoA mutase, partial [Actinobacteria bacterium]|nr:methylmalonyl-CoA mutase [Actinomycetota bacterium]
MHRPQHPVRVVTAASLFDGHDAAINVMRRILQAQGAEVVHLGHNRSVAEVVKAAVEEDADAVAVSSYQGGHLEYFEYLVARLRAEGMADTRVYGGGGGVIVAEEIERLARSGVRIFSPGDGLRLGLAGMVNTIVRECDVARARPVDVDALRAGSRPALAAVLTALELGQVEPDAMQAIRAGAAARTVPVLGITGVGGSGKSSLTDELVLRLRLDQDDRLRIAILAVDPTRRRAGGALLGDRIRMNAIDTDRVFFRSIATRSAAAELPAVVPAMVDACRAAGYDLVIVETPGIGQGDSAIVDVSDVSLYVMTPEFGAPTQLEKIDMLDFADVVAINKFDRRGAEDALRDVRRQLARNREVFDAPAESMPVFGTVAANFNDAGVTACSQALRDLLVLRGLHVGPGRLPSVPASATTVPAPFVPSDRARYLAEIAATVRAYHRETDAQVEALRTVDATHRVRADLAASGAA